MGREAVFETYEAQCDAEIAADKGAEAVKCAAGAEIFWIVEVVAGRHGDVTDKFDAVNGGDGVEWFDADRD